MGQIRPEYAALLILLQFTIYCDTQQFMKHTLVVPYYLCEYSSCHISPDELWYLQSLVRSDQTIILDHGTFTVDSENLIILIENVSNLTISGHESGSIIQCSPHSSFGFRLKNTTNVTLTNLNITSCGMAMKSLNYSDSWPIVHFDPPVFFETTILTEVSNNLTLSGINIESSPGVAITAIGTSVSADKEFREPEFLNPNLRLTDSTISQSKRGSLATYGHSYLLVNRTTFSNSNIGAIAYLTNMKLINVKIYNCTYSCMIDGNFIATKELIWNYSSLWSYKQNIFLMRNCKMTFVGENSQEGLLVSLSHFYVEENSAIVFSNFYLTLRSAYAFYLSKSSIFLNNSTLNFTRNTLSGGASICSVNDKSEIYMINGSSLIFTNNSLLASERAGLLIDVSSWNMTQDSNLVVERNIAKDGLLVEFLDMAATLNGSVKVSNNEVSYGVVNIIVSDVYFHGTVEMVENRAESGAITADSSSLIFTNKTTFSDNNAENGGAVTLTTSRMSFSPDAIVEFTRNHAQGLGGAIFIPKVRIFNSFCTNSEVKSTICSIQVLQEGATKVCKFSSFTFNQNRANIAGNAIYGGHTSACQPCTFQRDDNCSNLPVPNATELFGYKANDSSSLSSFTSDPTRVCFCEAGIPDCYKTMKHITVYPGEHFHLPLAIVGYGLGTVPGSVIARSLGRERVNPDQTVLGSELQYSQEISDTRCQNVGYSIVSGAHREVIALAVDTPSFVISPNKVKAIVNFQVTRNTSNRVFNYDAVYEHFFNIPVFANATLLPCPVGFQLVKGRCICHHMLLENNICTCSISNHTPFILRPYPFWIGLPNNTNSTILINPNCPFDYCQSEDINITSESFNIQCQYQRSGVLCGSCPKGLSMVLGSSECKACSNIYLASVGVFFLAGVTLVIFLTLLNMTVSIGTLNGLIVLANILEANRTTFLPQPTSCTSGIISVLSTFIAWLNLDLGIPMCFFNGLTTYVKTWLQFLFPLYIITLVCVIIIASKYSTQVTRLLGTNAVSVLATLILLSYTKILRILITAFSFTTLTGSQGYYSVVWLADGNIQYFELKHTILFLAALLVLLALEIPYTATLIATPWIQRSKYKWVSSLYNKFKPLFDAYMGPYKDKYRYWTGMLLLARVVLVVLFSSIANSNAVNGPQLNLLLLTFSSCALLVITAFLKPYKKQLLNALEIFHLAILFIFSAFNLYATHTATGIDLHAYSYIVLVGNCFLVFMGICVGHIWCKIRKSWNARRSKTEEGECRSLLWKRGTVKVDDEKEEREQATISTAASSNTSNVEKHHYRDSVLDLACS